MSEHSELRWDADRVEAHSAGQPDEPHQRRWAQYATQVSDGGAMLLARPALAQAPFPNRPIRVVIPAGPGGGTDILARLVVPKAADLLRSSIVIENRGGGEPDRH